jgi:type II secretory pathway component PulJ
VFLPVALALLAVMALLHATGLVWIQQTIERLTRVFGGALA